MSSDEEIICTLKSNLIPKTTSTYQILYSNTDTVTIEKDVIPNNVSIDRVTLASTRLLDQAPPTDGVMPGDHSPTLVESSEDKSSDTSERHPNSDTPLSKKISNDQSMQ